MRPHKGSEQRGFILLLFSSYRFFLLSCDSMDASKRYPAQRTFMEPGSMADVDEQPSVPTGVLRPVSPEFHSEEEGPIPPQLSIHAITHDQLLPDQPAQQCTPFPESESLRRVTPPWSILLTTATSVLTMGIPPSLNLHHGDIVDMESPSSEEWIAFQSRIVKDLKGDFIFHIFPLTAVSCTLALYGFKNWVLLSTLLATFICAFSATLQMVLFFAYFRAMSFRDTGKSFLKHVLDTRSRLQDSDILYLRWDPWIIFSLPSIWSVSVLLIVRAFLFLSISTIVAIISILFNSDGVSQSLIIPPKALILPLICLTLGGLSVGASAYTWRLYVTETTMHDAI
ncbi:hypothetical protein C8J57DRAFT_1213084 [Mycena rebaudengoi]|nr:hypothetical protein C8J57DRAFT_1213084 [Mycena rebaudengoi]